MRIVKLDRRYTQCRFNDYWYALHFSNPTGLLSYRIKCKLQDHYGPTGYAMFNNPSPWYCDYRVDGKDIIYLRDESMVTFLQLSGVLDESN